ncbi:DUF3870 domain-containing protein [Domibacillus aminovorans]|nr:MULTISPECIES: DUF3870 domain-containing protein [Bacillaceae]
MEEITNDYLAPSQQAVIVALKVAHQRYKDRLEVRKQKD